ncbi:hypothetical protein AXK56_11760 [Tsukamurella pulmonis]|uniref:Uncharacterized protein n=1 Tax=Tsukamurella pulmonis TaxID=47312 RepID=A0A1H1H429_9ACTN|nr:hypothetical protein [Tsukamurella pulmonis]KXO88054.1 hypothetical protein AXK56_11760 [Tsukamurella pulmonis]SDR20217.1 hypothetical protein SAMN04489765_3801 [Tsukamurella pulmonis]SUP15995.1 Uncharacterised protein [Tsukamurella pulmonis]
MITFKLKFGVGIRHDPAVTSWMARGFALDLGDRLHLEFRLRADWDPKWFGRSHEQGGMFTGYTGCVGPLALELDRRHLTYGEAVGAPSYLRDPALDWVIDEFDSSFNALAIASLRYHRDWSICDIGDERRAEFQQLIARLSEPMPKYTEEEQAAFVAAGDLFPEAEVGERVTMRPLTPAEQAAHEAWRIREAEWEQRIDEARRDFVGIMRYLWS